jgi:hypothetical protein
MVVAAVFLSYSTRDHFFAELIVEKLAKSNILVWRDQDQLRAGNDWRRSIEHGIAESAAVMVALSEASASSSYVTYEWRMHLAQAKQ